MTISDFGLSEKTVEQIRKVPEDYPAVEKAVLYGSRAKGTYRHGSDIDMTLFGAHLDLRVPAEIAGRLEELPVPYQVDLSLWGQINHEGLRQHILRVGVVFYKRRGDAVGGK